MSARLPHFELIRDDNRDDHKPFHARLKANGKVIWTTPNYVHRNGVRRAVEIACGPCGPWHIDPLEPPQDGKTYAWHGGWMAWLEVRDLTAKPAKPAEAGS